MANINSFKDKLLAGLGQAIDAGKDFAEKAVDATKDAAEKAADKAKTGSRIAKLNIEIAGERDNMKKTFIEIGKLYYDTHKDDPDGFFVVEFEEIVAEDEAAAEECCCGCGCEDKAEEAPAQECCCEDKTEE